MQFALAPAQHLAQFCFIQAMSVDACDAAFEEAGIPLEVGANRFAILGWFHASIRSSRRPNRSRNEVTAAATRTCVGLG